jgi:hypothetical protein
VGRKSTCQYGTPQVKKDFMPWALYITECLMGQFWCMTLQMKTHFRRCVVLLLWSKSVGRIGYSTQNVIWQIIQISPPEQVLWQRILSSLLYVVPFCDFIHPVLVQFSVFSPTWSPQWLCFYLLLRCQRNAAVIHTEQAHTAVPYPVPLFHVVFYICCLLPSIQIFPLYACFIMVCKNLPLFLIFVLLTYWLKPLCLLYKSGACNVTFWYCTFVIHNKPVFWTSILDGCADGHMHAQILFQSDGSTACSCISL